MGLRSAVILVGRFGLVLAVLKAASARSLLNGPDGEQRCPFFDLNGFESDGGVRPSAR